MRTGCCAGAVSSFWCKTMAQLDTMSDCALPAPCDGLEEWIEDRQRAVDSCFKKRSAWSDLDCRVWQHDYSFKSIEAWPLDACVVHSENASQNVLLGSLKAACSLADIHSWLAVRVNVVVTLCGREMTVRGAPQDWRQYFADFGARHLQGHLEDWTVKQPRNSADQLRQCALDCFTHWKHLCCQLWRLAKLHVCEKKDMQVLFHCFGGINRSAGALCAWLIVAYGFSAASAIDLLLEKRPGLRPWRHRRYVLWALYAVEQSRTSWRLDFGDCKDDLGERDLCDSSGQHNYLVSE